MTQALTELEQIDKQMQELAEKRKSVYEKDKTKALATIKELIAKFEFAAVDLGLKQRKERTVRNKTRKAKAATTIAKIEAGRTFSNGTETWTSGKRGKHPLWVSQRIKAGTLDECEVK